MFDTKRAASDHLVIFLLDIYFPSSGVQCNRPAVGEEYANKGANRHRGVHCACGGYLGREDD